MKPVVIVGGGPVGLFLACLLANSGREVRVLERRGGPACGARAIGIHPPALEALETVGAVAPLLDRGVRIERARVSSGRFTAALSLVDCPPPYPFVLSVDQAVTESVLQERLEELAPGSRCPGAEVVSAAPGCGVALASGRELEGDFVVGCDGRASRVRESLEVPVAGGAHDDHYLMADIPDESGLGDDAAIYLATAGVVESFPLPAGRRRWVARVGKRPQQASMRDLFRIIRRRTGQGLGAPTGSPSAFTAETRIAGRLAGPGWALAGDAAHVVSPIGGQGMNLGLLGALQLHRALQDGGSERSLAQYDRAQRSRARQAARRAGLNMALGRPGLPLAAKAMALRAIVAPPIRGRAARYFTMRGLE